MDKTAGVKVGFHRKRSDRSVEGEYEECRDGRSRLTDQGFGDGTQKLKTMSSCPTIKTKRMDNDVFLGGTLKSQILLLVN